MLIRMSQFSSIPALPMGPRFPFKYAPARTFQAECSLEAMNSLYASFHANLTSTHTGEEPRNYRPWRAAIRDVSFPLHGRSHALCLGWKEAVG